MAIAKLPYTVRYVLGSFSDKQAQEYVDSIVPALSEDEVLNVYSGLSMDDGYFKNNVSSFIDMDKLRGIISNEFRKIRKEPMDYWDTIVDVIGINFKKQILPKLKTLLESKTEQGVVPFTKIMESFLKYD